VSVQLEPGTRMARIASGAANVHTSKTVVQSSPDLGIPPGDLFGDLFGERFGQPRGPLSVRGAPRRVQYARSVHAGRREIPRSSRRG
jgi:hypothetical protein